ncbi:MAG: YceI family protein, partial [Polyangiaceae bacterium]
ASQIEVKIETASVDTRDPQRDGHLRSVDFFDAERFPYIEFRSTRIAEAGAKRYKVRGDLSIHGVKREIVLEATFGGQGRDPWGGQRVGFEATAKIERKEFGLQWNTALEAGGMLVGETVDVALQIEAKKAG